MYGNTGLGCYCCLGADLHSEMDQKSLVSQIQGELVGFNTINGEKVSNSQPCCMALLCLAVVVSLHFRC